MDFSNFEKKHAFIAGALLVLIVVFFAVGVWSRIPPKYASAASATSTWISTSNSSWSVAGNWSTGTVPGTSTNVLFSGSSTVNVTIDNNASVQAFTIVSGYTGTITQSSNYSLTVATSGFSQAAATFTGGTGAITVNGPFSLSAGTFTSTNNKLSLYGSVAFSGGTFNNNSGIVVLGSTSTPANVSGSATFYDLWLGDGTGSGNNVFTISTGTTLTVQASTTFAPLNTQIYLLGGGQIAAQGDILLNGVASGTAPTSTFNLTLTGSATQAINDQGYSTSTNPFYLPNLTINKTNGIALVSSTYVKVQSASVSSGELRIASNTAPQTFVDAGTFVVSSGAVVSDYPQASSTITLGSTVANNGFMFFDGSGPACYASSTLNYVVINSTASGTQRAWSGTGGFLIRYTNVKDQGGSASISDLNGISAGDNAVNWTFLAGPEVELVQSSSNAGGAGTTQLALSAFPYKPRAGDAVLVAVSSRNQTIAAPTDNASNTYVLVASSSFGSSPSYALSLYYAKNITPSSSLIVTVHGGGGTSPFLGGSAFEYTALDPSSTFDTDSVNTPAAMATTLTSLTSLGTSANELFFAAMTLSASTTASSGSGWKAESGISNNVTNQALYVEDMATSSVTSAAATWTAVTSTNYAAMMGIFHSPYIPGYNYGTLDSATFDTGVTGGAQLNSFTWEGTTPSNSSVEFQFAVNNSASGPWNFEGPDGTVGTYFFGSAGTPISLVATTGGYTLFNGYRYFRYRVSLFSDTSHLYTPTVNQITVNWSP